MVKHAIGKVAALGLFAKVALTGGAVALAGTGIAASLPHSGGDDEVQVLVESPDDETTETDVTDDETIDEEGAESDEDGLAPDGEGSPQGNHGAVVSEAAQDHSHDEECGNHGQWVSSVARGLESCLEDDGEEGEVEETEQTEQTEDQTVAPRSASGNAHAIGKSGKVKGKDR